MKLANIEVSEEPRGVGAMCIGLTPILMHETCSFCTAVDTVDATRHTANKADLTHEFNQTASAKPLQFSSGYCRALSHH
eukprot:scaffold563327_cov24-Prasinocladus_malaysianus.AAC.1